jgi:ABC-type uncharacterized transport system permease subunit
LAERAKSMNINIMNPYFLTGVGLFVISTCLFLWELWQQHAHEQNAMGTTKLGNRSLDIANIFWFLLLICWGLRYQSEGVKRLLMGLSVVGIYAFYKLVLKRYQIASIGILFAFFSVLFSFASYSFTQPIHLEEGLQKGILYVHIFLAIIAITGFSLSALFSALFLLQNKRLKDKKNVGLKKIGPSLDVLDEYAFKQILIAFPAYTISLILGSAEAFKLGQIKTAYLIAIFSWLMYAVTIQMRVIAGWRGKKANYLTLLALLCLFLVLSQYAWRG